MTTPSYTRQHETCLESLLLTKLDNISVHIHTPYTVYTPSERQRRNSSARTDFPRERTVGAKNMHSSSGCAVIRSIRPVMSRSVDPAAALTRSHERAAVISTTSRATDTSRSILSRQPYSPLLHESCVENLNARAHSSAGASRTRYDPRIETHWHAVQCIRLCSKH